MDNGKLTKNSIVLFLRKKMPMILGVVVLIVIVTLLAVLLGPYLGLPWWVNLILAVWCLLCGFGGLALSGKLRKQMYK